MDLFIYLSDNYIDSLQIGTGLSACVSNELWRNKLGNTLNNHGFQKLITAKLKIRESELLTNQSLTMEVDKSIADIFTSNRMVSGMFILCDYASSSERSVSSIIEEGTIKETERCNNR